MKRGFDFIISFLGLIVLGLFAFVLFPLQIALMGFPLFFRQERAGRNGKTFYILKFRTMLKGTGSDEERLTKWGRLLRATSIDELPELWNVLKGEMSLVGPRPLPTAYLPLYSKAQARRHDVLPGITGWAQINGRNGISWEKQFELDLWYVENASLWLDLKILSGTIKAVLVRKNINESEAVTRRPFTGSESLGR